MTAVVERLEPEQLFEWFVAQRAAMGLTAVPLGDGSSSALLRALKANKVAGLVSDRDMVGNGVEVEFFGERTTLPAGAATLALRTGAPLLPVVVYSGPGNWHTGVVHPPLDTTRRGRMREDIARVTQDLATDVRARHPRPPRAVAPLPAELAERSPMRIAMLSPYSLSRPGGVQGQVIGLSHALRARGHEVTVLAPASEQDGARRRRGALRHRPADRAALERVGGAGGALADGGGARRALRPHGRLRRRAPARAPGADGRLRPGAHGTAPHGRHLPPGRGEPVGARAEAAGRAGGAAHADPRGGLGGGAPDGPALGRRRLRGPVQRGRDGAVRVGAAACATRRAGRRSCSSAATNSARA